MSGLSSGSSPTVRRHRGSAGGIPCSYRRLRLRARSCARLEGAGRGKELPAVLGEEGKQLQWRKGIKKKKKPMRKEAANIKWVTHGTGWLIPSGHSSCCAGNRCRAPGGERRAAVGSVGAAGAELRSAAPGESRARREDGPVPAGLRGWGHPEAGTCGSAAVTYFLPVPPGARHRRCPRHLPGLSGPRARGGALLPARSSVRSTAPRPALCARRPAAGAGGGGAGKQRACAVPGGRAQPAVLHNQPPPQPSFTSPAAAARSPSPPCAHPCAAHCRRWAPSCPRSCHVTAGQRDPTVTRVAGGAPRRGWVWQWERPRDAHPPRRYVRPRGPRALPRWGVREGAGAAREKPRLRGRYAALRAPPCLRRTLPGRSQVSSEN